MALQDLLDINTKRQKIGLSEERINAIKKPLRDYIAFWREYPDLFVDFMARGSRTEVKEGEFHFYFYQRVFLRCVMRHQYVYAVFPRAYSKSFLSVMALMIRCILYPRANLFVTSGGKEQAAGILKDKVNEICTLIPAFDREIDRRRGKTLEGKIIVNMFLKVAQLQTILRRERVLEVSVATVDQQRSVSVLMTKFCAKLLFLLWLFLVELWMGVSNLKKH